MPDSPATSDPTLEHEDAEREAATKAQVLCAAERLFAVHGFQNVSVRDITAEAGVNLASVNYQTSHSDAFSWQRTQSSSSDRPGSF